MGGNDMKWRRILAVWIVVVLMLSVSAYAEERNDGISPRYTYTWSMEAGLHISDAAVAECHGSVITYDVNSTISIKVSLYEKVGNSWDRIKSWYGNSTGNGAFGMTRYYQLTEYGTYKVLVTGTVTGVDGGQEWLSLESDHMTYP